MSDGVGAWRVPKSYAVTTPMLGAEPGRVRLAVRAIQTELAHRGCMPLEEVDGWYGRKTAAAVRRFQIETGLVDARARNTSFGPRTAKALFLPLVRWWQGALVIPDNLLAGLLQIESAWDPGAEGTSAVGVDEGLAQINSWYHRDSPLLAATERVAPEQAYDPRFAVMWTAGRLIESFCALRNWDAAIAAHNSEVGGREWARVGRAPNDRVATYVRLVRGAAGPA